ncbi:50S ribosomal protein L29 [Owenweeksia hongkongensis]|uniref:50S ribosomal protein L29 n=1 Tax=Owenweeksia hongkongensis TaxID=253245 RepID=UPI003A921AA0
MKASVVREMTTQEIKEQLEELKLTYSKTKMGHTISPLENPLELKKARKNIARLSTELRSRELTSEQQ